MLLTTFLFFFLITIGSSITQVPGRIHVKLLRNNQIANKTYRPSATVHYLVKFENIPIDDDVAFGVEIRGSNPNGGPRGYIATAYNVTSIKTFIKQTHTHLAFKLIPNEVFAGYHWFLRPFVFFTNESMGSTNMMNSGASKMFTVLKQ